VTPQAGDGRRGPHVDGEYNANGVPVRDYPITLDKLLAPVPVLTEPAADTAEDLWSPRSAECARKR
jgi:hypothetical protein